MRSKYQTPVCTCSTETEWREREREREIDFDASKPHSPPVYTQARDATNPFSRTPCYASPSLNEVGWQETTLYALYELYDVGAAVCAHAQSFFACLPTPGSSRNSTAADRLSLSGGLKARLSSVPISRIRLLLQAHKRMHAPTIPALSTPIL